MDLDAGDGARHRGEHSRRQPAARPLPQLVQAPVRPDGVQARRRQHHLEPGVRGRVALDGAVDVLERPVGELAHETERAGIPKRSSEASRRLVPRPASPRTSVSGFSAGLGPWSICGAVLMHELLGVLVCDDGQSTRPSKRMVDR